MPVEPSRLHAAQKKDPSLLKKAAENPDYHLKIVHGGGKSYDLICHNDKIVVPKPLQQKIVTWYHTLLCHPGETRTEQTLRQHFTWKNLKDQVHQHVSTCRTCQLNKRKTKKYGHLPAKKAEAKPWEVLCVDLIGPYTIQRPRKTKRNKKSSKSKKKIR